jgi:mRNA interferase RelE/StbE
LILNTTRKGRLGLMIQYSKQAVKFLQKQDRVTQKRIIDAIQKLPLGDVKKLRGQIGYRLRVGDYRIIFDRSGNVIFIEKIDNRGEVYK